MFDFMFEVKEFLHLRSVESQRVIDILLQCSYYFSVDAYHRKLFH